MVEGSTAVRPALLVGWLAALVAVIVGFTALGGGALAAPALTDPAGWGAWADGRDPVVATAAVLRLVVLALAWYLLGTTLVGALARLARWGALVRVADVLSVPAVRRVLQASVGAGLAATVVVSSSGLPAPAGPAPQGPTISAAAGQASSAGMDVLPPPGLAPVPTAPTEAAAPVPVAPLPPEPAESPASADTADAAEDLVTVAPGDHLWAIAERHLAAVRGVDVPEAEVAAYWVRLVEANRGRLVDPDDPDLVLPGQRFVLPALDRASTP